MALPFLTRIDDMKLRYNGKNTVTIRGVTFPQGKAVEVNDESLIEKMIAWPDVDEVKTRKSKKNANIE